MEKGETEAKAEYGKPWIWSIDGEVNAFGGELEGEVVVTGDGMISFSYRVPFLDFWDEEEEEEDEDEDEEE